MKKDIAIENADIEVEENEPCEEITTPFSPNDIRLNTPPMNMGDIIDMIERGYIDFDTDYQREQNLWDDAQQSRLIESILLGLRLPAFYFEEVSKKKWRIIDGLQRCCAIRNFCVDGTLTLGNLEFLSEDFDGKDYKNFSFDTKRDVRMLPVTVNLLEKGTPDDVKYILFKRLNTGGITLSPQEIRNAIYIGKAIDVVRELSHDQSFLRATSYKIPTLRKQDMDFVSRFVAFYLIGYENYKTPDLDNFINTCMKGINEGLYDKELEKMKENFVKAMNLAYEIFEGDAFRKRKDILEKRRPLNKAYFEVISVIFSQLMDDEAKKLVEKKGPFKERLIQEMKVSEAYFNSFSVGTATKDSVKKRFSTFNEIVQETINKSYT